MESLELRRIQDSDISIMRRWLYKDYIIKWYEDPEAWIKEIAERDNEFKFIKHFIVLYEEKPIGFCQYYTCLDAEEEWYGEIPLEGTYSIDYLIGEEEYLGKGFGKAIIGLLVQKIFLLDDAKRIIVLPEQDNKPSINSLLANGFYFDEKNRLYIKTKYTKVNSFVDNFNNFNKKCE